MNTQPAIQSENINLIRIMAEVDKNGLETQKNTRLKRELHHQKKIAHGQQKIKQMEKEKSKSFWSSIFNTIMQLIGPALQALDSIAPGLGTALKILANSGILNPFSQGSKQAQIDQEKFQLLTENEQKLYQVESDRLNEQKQHHQTNSNRLEKAIHNLQESQSLAVRA